MENGRTTVRTREEGLPFRQAVVRYDLLPCVGWILGVGFAASVAILLHGPFDRDGLDGTLPPRLAFDAETARAKVMALELRWVEPPDLGPEMKMDLIRLGVPVRAASIVHGNGGDVTFPFVARVDHVIADGSSDTTLDQQRWMIVVMVGRRIASQNLHVSTFHLASWRGESKVAEVVLSEELARRAAVEGGGAEEVTALFHR